MPLESKRGGAGRGQGRKPLAKSGELMKARQVRMTDEEWEKCKRLGGAAWVRAKIKAAREPQPQPATKINTTANTEEQNESPRMAKTR